MKEQILLTVLSKEGKDQPDLDFKPRIKEFRRSQDYKAVLQGASLYRAVINYCKGLGFELDQKQITGTKMHVIAKHLKEV